MNLALFTILLAIGWAAATGSFTLPNLIFGAIVGGLGLYVVRRYVSGPALMPRARRIVSLALLFFYELFVSAFRVARLVLRVDIGKHLKPAIIAFPLTATSDAEITLLANLITLTPGTLSVDVSADRRLLYVHAIAVSDREAFVRDIAEGFERKVMEAFR
jgi:multicomponent Na+:H+ antiporter subunit E